MSQFHDDDDLYKVLRIDGNLDWFVMNHFCEPINNNKYWVIAVSFLIRQNLQTCDKICQ